MIALDAYKAIMPYLSLVDTVDDYNMYDVMECFVIKISVPDSGHWHQVRTVSVSNSKIAFGLGDSASYGCKTQFDLHENFTIRLEISKLNHILII